MKLTAFLLLITFISVRASVYSQITRLDLKVHSTTVKEVLSRIEDQSEFSFMYNDRKIDVERKVDLDFKQAKIEDLLNTIFEGTNTKFIIKDRQIVLYNENEEINRVSGNEAVTQQQKSVSGKVSDSSGGSLPGVSIVIKGTTSGVITDMDGKYTISKIPENATLQFSFVGMKTQEITVGSKTTINVSLVEEVVGLEEVVAIGYGTQRKIEVTSAAVSVKSDDFVKGSVKDAGQLLQGKVAGLTIATPSGDGKTEIMLRGIGTLNSGVGPLVLVDGIPGNLWTVSPEDIESVDVLKDASAAAIYGTRGSNGVILIATKKHSGNIEPTLDYSSYLSTQSFLSLPNMLTPAQYRDRISKGTKGFVDEGSNTDWVKEISRNTPISHNHNLSIRGGNNKTNYLATIGFRNSQGVIITTEDQRINSRVDINHNMFDDKLKLNFNFIQNETKGSAAFDNVAFRNAVRYNPTAPVYNADGTYFENFGPTENYNPVEMIKETFGGSHEHSFRISPSLTWNPIEGLNLKMLTSRSTYNYNAGLGHTKQHYSTTMSGKNGEANQSYSESIDNLLELSAQYTKTINAHKFMVLGGYSYQDSENQNGSMYNYDFPVGNFSYIDNIGLGQAAKLGLSNMSSSKYVSNLIGFYGRATYNYKEKYLVMANLRYEGASQLYGANQPWGTFPSVSVGWRVSEEDFMKQFTFLDNLKIRAGYGVTGTAPSQSFLGVDMLNYSGSFLYNGKWEPSIVPASNGNPYLQWEERHETNIGLDFSVLKGRLSGTIDLYNRQTKGLLFDYQVPSPPNLYPITKANVGVMENKGIEILVSAIPVQTGKFSWNSNVTFSTNKNKLVSLENDLYKLTTPYFDDGRSPTPIGEPTHRIEVGQPIGNFYGYEVKGVTDDGHWIYVNGAGRDTSAVNPATDRKIIGNGLPKYNLAWNNTLKYGKLDLEINMRGAFGFQIMNSTRMLYENPGFDNYNQLNSAYDKIYGTAVLAKDVNVQNNSYYVEQGDYWKIDNVVLGYNFDVRKISHIKNAHLFVSVKNAMTITGYKGMDPEVSLYGTTGSQQLTAGYDNRDTYPASRIYTLGFNITLK